ALSPRRRRIESVVLPLLAGAVIVALWHAAVVATGTKVLPSPLAVVSGVVELARSGVLVRYVGDSLFRVGVGFTLAVLAGVPLGLALGLYPPLEAALNPVIQ